MKILKYKLATEINHGTPEKPIMETILSDVSMPYITEADYQLALSEAWQGEVTVEEVPETADEIRARRDRLVRPPGVELFHGGDGLAGDGVFQPRLGEEGLHLPF